MNTNNQPDIEIYVKDTTADEIRGWLEKRLGTLVDEPAKGSIAYFRAERDGDVIPVRVVKGAVGKAWTCVWLDSPDTPWADDLACARDCFAVLGKQVRCSAGNYDELRGDDPDAFIRIDADGETMISWKTE